MVSWINMYPDSSGYVGTVGTYNRIATSDPLDERVARFNYILGAVLASPGVVDLNAPTRHQYLASAVFLPRMVGQAGFRIDADDVVAYPGMNFMGSMFVTPATAFADGYVPTANEIRLNATQVVRGIGGFGSPSSRTTAGDLHTLTMYPLTETVYAPNEKYWIMVTPTVVADTGSTPSIANDIPVGVSANDHGRALSVWTNRTPLAPIITSPAGQTTTFAGTEIDFVFLPQDPDKVTNFPGDSGPNDFDDVAGVHVQYAPYPTAENPTPEWIDLPIANTGGTYFGRGWFIQDSATEAVDDGAKQFWNTYKLKIRCGAVTPLAPNAAYLPSGDWQVRVRTFDYGHGWSDSAGIIVSPPGAPGLPPLVDYTGGHTPDNYPAVNTSPWSEPVRLLVSAQVPKPLALSPVNSTAIIEGTPVTLSWQYRNTYDPPFDQDERTVQIRERNDTEWTTLVSGASSDDSYLISGYDLVSGNRYSWRVQVTDTSGAVSEYSDPAYFWVVPAPESGAVIPTPGETIDGAALGCGTYRVFVYRRGGKVRVGEITDISYLDWERVRDDISTAKVVVSNWGIDCGNLLKQLESWAYEIVIFRNNGYSIDRVWEGPITLPSYEWDKVTILAKDVMAYAYRRIIKQRLSDAAVGATVVDRAMRVLQNAFAPDDPNVLSYLQVLNHEDDARQYRTTPAYSRTAFEEVDDMAANSGLDYTAMGRAILLWGTKHRIGTLPEFRDKDLGNSPIVSEYGMSMANVYAVSDGNGVYGEADRLDEDGADSKYGLVEMLSSTWASETPAETGTYTQAGLETIRESFADAAERSISDRYPPPVVVRVPDNTRLNPDTVLSIQQLVPGVVVPLRSTGTLREVVATQKLDSVKVVVEKGEETITITLSPFSRDDVEAGEEAEE